MQSVKCPLCGQTESTFLWERDGARYVRCSQCTLVYENPRLTEEELKQFYSREAYFVAETGKDSASGYADYFNQCNTGLVQEYFSIVQRMTGGGPGTQLLDVGCGPGGLLDVAGEHGWIGTGVELSSWAADLGKKSGRNIFEGTLHQAGFPDASFDVITMFDVLEHLPDPRSIAKEIFRILKPGGWLIAETPNVEGFFAKNLYKEHADLVKPRAHISLFSPATARFLFASEGFSTVKVSTFPYCRKFTPGYFKSLIVTRLRPGAVKRQLTYNESLRICVQK